MFPQKGPKALSVKVTFYGRPSLNCNFIRVLDYSFSSYDELLYSLGLPSQLNPKTFVSD